MKELDCDFYVSNLHKWFFAPRGCSFLYFKDLEHAKSHLQPNFISWGYRSSVNFNFFSRATSDKTALYLVEESVRYHSQVFGGLKRIQAYTDQLLNQAVDLLTTGWGTERFAIDVSLQAPHMRLVAMPPFRKYPNVTEANSGEISALIMKELMEKYRVVAPFVFINSAFYCRISAFVYSDISDFIRLKDAIIDYNK